MSPVQNARINSADHPLAPFLASSHTSNYVARIALDPKTRQDAFRLRYESYLYFGYISPNDDELFFDEYDSLPNSRTVVLYRFGVPVGSVRTCLLTTRGGQRGASPASHAFPEEVERILAGNRPSGHGGFRAVETTRLVRSPSALNSTGLIFMLYRMAAYIGIAADAEILLACVREEHVSFYQRLGYSSKTGLRPYPGLHCPMLLMACDRERYDVTRLTYPILDPFAGATGPLEGFLSGEPVALALLAPQ
ncbi:N-acyl amino acid synthase FeeM domain-containing protein [Acetobacter sacchari]|uniref:N-acyl amino acid synthase FeeM domain-containing protein n=1 Tax=Acetobacter sacchari TaxID=2661687 RepID=UPI001FAF8B1A|nr:hypothetical protein [Acetobacter sacchari]